MSQEKRHAKFYYECNDCGKQYDNSTIRYLCPICESGNTIELPPKGVLKVIYNYNKVSSSFSDLKENDFLEILPIQKVESLPNLKIGDTPLYSIDQLNNSPLPFHLFLKDDSQNPTYSFKDRASSVVSAFAKEQGINTIITASTGNAGSSLAGICAAQKQKAIILLPETAPIAKLTQSLMYGAEVIRIKGTYDDAFDLSLEATKHLGLYNRNTAFNPLTIEGKKTVSFELFEQLKFKVPDNIFIPVGDGVIISGVYKGFEELLQIGLIEKMPAIIAVQANKSNNLVRNIGTQEFKIEKSTTIADSISVDIPRNYYMTKKYLEKYNGKTTSVSDKEIIKASSSLSINTGLFQEPASVAAFAGFLKYYHESKLFENSSNVVLLTGSGLKDLKVFDGILSIPKPIAPELEELKPKLK